MFGDNWAEVVDHVGTKSQVCDRTVGMGTCPIKLLIHRLIGCMMPRLASGTICLLSPRR